MVPGDLPPGSYLLTDVAVDVSGLPAADNAVGDQDGDGNDDVAFPEVAQFPDGAPELNPAATVVYSGPDLLAPGPGGRLDERPVPLARYQGSSVAVAVLDPAGPPTVITGVRTPDGIDQLTLHGDPQVHLRAEGLLEEYTGGPGTITVTQRGTTRFVVLRSDTRGGSSLAIWNLDDPCSRYASGPLPHPLTRDRPPPPDRTPPPPPPPDRRPLDRPPPARPPPDRPLAPRARKRPHQLSHYQERPPSPVDRRNPGKGPTGRRRWLRRPWRCGSWSGARTRRRRPRPATPPGR